MSPRSGGRGGVLGHNRHPVGRYRQADAQATGQRQGQDVALCLRSGAVWLLAIRSSPPIPVNRLGNRRGTSPGLQCGCWKRCTHFRVAYACLCVARTWVPRASRRRQAACTSSMTLVLLRAHGARYEVQARMCTNLLWFDLESIFSAGKFGGFIRLVSLRCRLLTSNS